MSACITGFHAPIPQPVSAAHGGVAPVVPVVVTPPVGEILPRRYYPPEYRRIPVRLNALTYLTIIRRLKMAGDTFVQLTRQVEAVAKYGISTTYKILLKRPIEYVLEYKLETHSLSKVVERLEREIKRLKNALKLLLLEEIE